MFNSIILDVAIGMAFVYLLLSMLCSAAAEVIAGLLNSRAKNLEKGIRSLFSDGVGPNGNAFVREIYEHGLIRGLYRDKALDLVPVSKKDPTRKYSFAKDDPRKFSQINRGKTDTGVGGAGLAVTSSTDTGLVPDKNSRKLPSYIPARTFALALLDILNKTPQTQADQARQSDPQGGQTQPSGQTISPTPPTGSSPSPAIDSIRSTINGLPSSSAKQALQSLLLSSENKLTTLETNLENWYNDAMDRAAGWYKRRNQWVLLGFGLALAVLVNANSITLVRVLWVDKGVREATVENASKYLKDNSNAPTDSSMAEGKDALDQEKNYLDQLGKKIDLLRDTESKTLLPLGWKAGPPWKDPSYSATKFGTDLLGWILTAIALSLGAPFWFDLLNKFMVVRSTIKPQEKSQLEKSKD
jgi:hypothetical protein